MWRSHRNLRTASWLLPLLIGWSATASAQSISLASFFPSSARVQIFAQGSSAVLDESRATSFLQLINDPEVGDAGGIGGGEKTLSLVYEFIESAEGDDLFSVVVFDADQGPSEGAVQVFEQTDPGAGLIQFDLEPWLDRPLGILIELIELDRRNGDANSSVTVSRMQQTAFILDSDGDGMSDSYEKAAGLDANRDDRNGDLDQDGLSNFLEYVKGTDAGNADSDGDSVPDGLEVDENLNPLDGSDCPSWICGSILKRILPFIQSQQ